MERKLKQLFFLAPTIILLWIISQNPKFLKNEKSQFKIENIGNTQVCFTPGGECQDLIVSAIENSKKSIKMQSYSFTSMPIAQALVNAQRRGIKVEAILDKSNISEKYTAADFLIHSNIPTWIDSAHAIAHNKIMIMDEQVTITGSYNFTKAAQERNAENVLIIYQPEIAIKYSQNWQEHLQHSQLYK